MLCQQFGFVSYVTPGLFNIDVKNGGDKKKRWENFLWRVWWAWDLAKWTLCKNPGSRTTSSMTKLTGCVDCHYIKLVLPNFRLTWLNRCFAAAAPSHRYVSQNNMNALLVVHLSVLLFSQSCHFCSALDLSILYHPIHSSACVFRSKSFPRCQRSATSIRPPTSPYMWYWLMAGYAPDEGQHERLPGTHIAYK